MTIALISDIHANLAALRVVLKSIQEHGITEVHCLGDVVDYGSEPVECLKKVHNICGENRVLGNHDLAVGNIDRDSQVDESWHPATEWTAETLGEAGLNKLIDGVRLSYNFNCGRIRVSVAHALPVIAPKYQYGECTPYLYAGSRNRPVTKELGQIFAAMQERDIRVAAYGHTHIPFLLSQPHGLLSVIAKPELVKPSRGPAEYFVKLNGHNSVIVNVPALGQPRDNDPRTGYTIISEDEVRIVRLDYDIRETLEGMRNSKMPIKDASRLYLENFLMFGDSLPTQSQRTRASKPEKE